MNQEVHCVSFFFEKSMFTVVQKLLEKIYTNNCIFCILKVNGQLWAGHTTRESRKNEILVYTAQYVGSYWCRVNSIVSLISKAFFLPRSWLDDRSVLTSYFLLCFFLCKAKKALQQLPFEYICREYIWCDFPCITTALGTWSRFTRCI